MEESSDYLSKDDLAILREQFPSLFMFEDFFSDEELAEIDRLEQEAFKED